MGPIRWLWHQFGPLACPHFVILENPFAKQTSIENRTISHCQSDISVRKIIKTQLSKRLRDNPVDFDNLTLDLQHIQRRQIKGDIMGKLMIAFGCLMVATIQVAAQVLTGEVMAQEPIEKVGFQKPTEKVAFQKPTVKIAAQKLTEEGCVKEIMPLYVSSLLFKSAQLSCDEFYGIENGLFDALIEQHPNCNNFREHLPLKVEATVLSSATTFFLNKYKKFIERCPHQAVEEKSTGEANQESEGLKATTAHGIEIPDDCYNLAGFQFRNMLRGYDESIACSTFHSDQNLIFLAYNNACNEHEAGFLKDLDLYITRVRDEIAVKYESIKKRCDEEKEAAAKESAEWQNKLDSIDELRGYYFPDYNEY